MKNWKWQKKVAYYTAKYLEIFSLSLCSRYLAVTMQNGATDLCDVSIQLQTLQTINHPFFRFLSAYSIPWFSHCIENIYR